MTPCKTPRIALIPINFLAISQDFALIHARLGVIRTWLVKYGHNMLSFGHKKFFCVQKDRTCDPLGPPWPREEAVWYCSCVSPLIKLKVLRKNNWSYLLGSKRNTRSSCCHPRYLVISWVRKSKLVKGEFIWNNLFAYLANSHRSIHTVHPEADLESYLQCNFHCQSLLKHAMWQSLRSIALCQQAKKHHFTNHLSPCNTLRTPNNY